MKAPLLTGTMIAALAAAASFPHAKTESLGTAGLAQSGVTGTQSGSGGIVVAQSTPTKPSKPADSDWPK
jgi:hypothetical protein